MLLAKAADLPDLASSHVLSSMTRIVFPLGERMQPPKGEFFYHPVGVLISAMNTVEETRRIKLRMLVARHNNSMATLCEKLGYARTETAGLTRILNANIRHDRDGKPYNMGSPTARYIEEKLELELGWMDTPPTYAEMSGEEDPRAKVVLAMERMSTQEIYQLQRFVDAVAQPTQNGTNGN